MSAQNIVPNEPYDSIEELYEPYILRNDETTFRIVKIDHKYPKIIKKSNNVKSEPTKSSNSRDLSNENLESKYEERQVYSAVLKQESDRESFEEVGSESID